QLAQFLNTEIIEDKLIEFFLFCGDARRRLQALSVSDRCTTRTSLVQGLHRRNPFSPAVSIVS
ncbi:hypothetical protein KIP88_44520, partial [Bradyrhizobium sp. SRL28]|uniref:hypothetical protein n=1 Tax=Bradyrhizobium sp. SRL28 TaxID=2836178 RepID=UPI001BDDD55A